LPKTSPQEKTRAAPATSAAPIEEAPDAVADASIDGAVGCVQVLAEIRRPAAERG
jgi:hypothetical protein